MLLTRTFTSLGSSNYRRYFAVLSLSSIGVWMRLIAENWLVVEITGASGIALGITAALQFTPMLLFGLYAGVLVDRANRRRIVIVTQTLASVLALTLALATWSGVVTIALVWIMVGLMGLVNAIDIPAREAFTKELVGRDRVANAVALNSGAQTAARMVGPALAGLLIAVAGLHTAFLVNSVTHFVVVLGLLTINVHKLFRGEPVARERGQIREGLAYIRHHGVLGPVVISMILVFTFAYNFQVLLPLLAADSYGGGSQLYGYLMSAMGIGALAGSLLAATLSRTGVGFVACSSGILAIAQFGVAAAPGPWVGAAAATAMGMSASLFQVACSGTLQHHTDEAKRGRVLAVYAIGFTGTGAVGGPAIGAIAEAWSPKMGFVVAGTACLVAMGLAMLLGARSSAGAQRAAPASRL